jgi:type IV pilus assembly protein PilA
MRDRERGFSLIELLIVVMVILIIAAIAIPNFMRSRTAANQASAVQSLRVIGSAEANYSSTYGTGFSANLAQLGPPAGGAQVSTSAAGLIDDLLAAGAKSGYNFVYTPTTQDSTGKYNGFTIQANPSVFGQTGNNYYFLDETNVIRSNTSTTAASTDSPIGQ